MSLFVFILTSQFFAQMLSHFDNVCACCGLPVFMFKWITAVGGPCGESGLGGDGPGGPLLLGDFVFLLCCVCKKRLSVISLLICFDIKHIYFDYLSFCSVSVHLSLL